MCVNIEFMQIAEIFLRICVLDWQHIRFVLGPANLVLLLLVKFYDLVNPNRIDSTRFYTISPAILIKILP